MERRSCALVIGVRTITLADIARGSARSRIIDASERRARARWLRSDLDRNGPGERLEGRLVEWGLMRGGEVVVHS
jgi:hypothetical protein